MFADSPINPKRNVHRGVAPVGQRREGFLCVKTGSFGKPPTAFCHVARSRDCGGSEKAWKTRQFHESFLLVLGRNPSRRCPLGCRWLLPIVTQGFASLRPGLWTPAPLGPAGDARFVAPKVRYSSAQGATLGTRATNVP